MLNIDNFLGYVKTRKFYNKQIVHIEDIPPKPAEFGALDIPLHDSLMNGDDRERAGSQRELLAE